MDQCLSMCCAQAALRFHTAGKKDALGAAHLVLDFMDRTRKLPPMCTYAACQACCAKICSCRDAFWVTLRDIRGTSCLATADLVLACQKLHAASLSPPEHMQTVSLVGSGPAGLACIPVIHKRGCMPHPCLSAGINSAVIPILELYSRP